MTVRDSWLALEHAAMARIARPDAILVPACARGIEADVESGARNLAASAVRADAIVCGASGHDHHAPLPVLIVPPQDEPADGPLLVGYDGSEHAKDAIRTAGVGAR